jgi:hypothetical protein
MSFAELFNLCYRLLAAQNTQVKESFQRAILYYTLLFVDLFGGVAWRYIER